MLVVGIVDRVGLIEAILLVLELVVGIVVLAGDGQSHVGTLKLVGAHVGGEADAQNGTTGDRPDAAVVTQVLGHLREEGKETEAATLTGLLLRHDGRVGSGR